jgi:hypothetical protein
MSVGRVWKNMRKGPIPSGRPSSADPPEQISGKGGHRHAPMKLPARMGKNRSLNGNMWLDTEP